MYVLQEMLRDSSTKLVDKLDLEWNSFNEELAAKLYNFIKFAETGDVSYMKTEMTRLKGEDKPLDNSKENVHPNETSTVVLPKRTTRQKNASVAVPQIVIKQEKMSMIPPESVTTSNSSDTRNDAKVETREMLAPTTLPPRKKKIKEEPVEPVKRSTRTKTKRLLEESQMNCSKQSDVIIQNTTITMIDISEDKESDTEKKKVQKDTTNETETIKETRSTRTKTRQKKQAKEEQKDDMDLNQTQTKVRANKRKTGEVEKKIEAKRSKSSSSSDKDPNKSALTDYEDAVSTFDPTEEPATVQLPVTMNETVVVEKPKVVKQDEGKEENYRTPPPTKSKKAQIKEIFSPYDKTTTKKKVEAFEKLGNSSTQVGSNSKIPLRDDTNYDPMKTKPFTPFTNKFVPKNCSTSVKISRINSCNSVTKDNSVSMKSLSALKASQAEYRELEKRRQEKEREAQMKKEALLLAQAEEKRRKREEKQLKAQQQREMIQKEREKQLEVQRIKDEKYKQAIAEKEEKLQKSKEEAEKKRLLAKNKAKLAKESQSAEEKAIENERNHSKARTTRTDGHQHVPIYMVTKAPLLPTDDCYDSDDDEYRNKKYVKPKWSRDDVLKRQLYVQLKAGEKIKNTLFCCQTQSPDLIDIFESIDPRKLKRTSSAVWKKPPRYTLFSMTSDIIFSEDSEESADV